MIPCVQNKNIPAYSIRKKCIWQSYMKKICSFLLGLDVLLLLIISGRIAENGVLHQAGAMAEKQNSLPAMQTEREEVDLSMKDMSEKKIALTFDDGPHPVCTEQLLKGLRDRNVKATFFLTGKNVDAYPEIVKEMYEDGHLIGNHTYNHIQLTNGNTEEFKQELKDTSEAIKKVTGQDTMYVRPPYGAWKKEFEKELNMFPILWSIDPKDWCSNDASCVVEKVCSEAGENDIILLHDQYESSVTAALKIIDKLTVEGFEFVTVDELLFD